jgi:4a-hydroxytetrahydrobiopterin dehydratase
MSTISVVSWDVVTHDGCDALRRTFSFANWSEALAFLNKVGAIADAQDHHPLAEITWGRVTITVWSHDVGGLSERDRRFCETTNAL